MRRLSVVFVLPLAACSYFGGGGSEKEPPTATNIGRLTTDCARLQPLFGTDQQELSREQMETALQAEFAKADKDGDGGLSFSEAQPVNDALRDENVRASPVTDWNGDGRVDFKEYGSGWRTMFDYCDRNANAVVSLRELGYSPNVTGPRVAPAKKKPEGASTPPANGGAY